MSNKIIILDMFYTKHLKPKDIALELNVSTAYITKIIKNDSRYANKKDDVLIEVMKRQHIQENLSTTRKTVISIFKQLEELNLITQIEQKKGLAFKIYINDIFTNKYTKNKVMENLHVTSGESTPAR